eukprot:1025578-Prymnesium_polylepis.1
MRRECVRESANPSRIRESVANPRIHCALRIFPNALRTCANQVENFRGSVANLCKPGRELSRIRRESMDIRCKFLRTLMQNPRMPPFTSPVRRDMT